MKAKRYQERAVDEIVTRLKSVMSGATEVRQGELTAPTGSGKTFILAEAIRQMLAENPHNVVFWLTPGHGELEEQAKSKIEAHFNENNDNSRIEFIRSRANARNTLDVIDSGGIYVANWNQLGGANNILSQERFSEMMDGMREMMIDGAKVFVVIDEAHYACDSDQNQRIRSSINADYTLRVTATPKPGRADANGFVEPSDKFEVSAEDVRGEQAIKKEVVVNSPEEIDETIQGAWETLIQAAVETRNKILMRMDKIPELERVNPLIILEVPGLADDNLTELESILSSEKIGFHRADQNELMERHSALDKAEWNAYAVHIQVPNGRNLLKKDEFNAIKRNDSPVSAILVKDAIKMGWDCPRAQILVNLRNIHNDRTRTQFVGRIIRALGMKHYGDEYIDNAFIFTNMSRSLWAEIHPSSNEMPIGIKGYEKLELKEGALSAVFENNCPNHLRFKDPDEIIEIGHMDRIVREIEGSTLIKSSIEHANSLLKKEYDNRTLTIEGFRVPTQEGGKLACPVQVTAKQIRMNARDNERVFYDRIRQHAYDCEVISLVSRPHQEQIVESIVAAFYRVINKQDRELIDGIMGYFAAHREISEDINTIIGILQLDGIFPSEHNWESVKYEPAKTISAPIFDQEKSRGYEHCAYEGYRSGQPENTPESRPELHFQAYLDDILGDRGQIQHWHRLAIGELGIKLYKDDNMVLANSKMSPDYLVQHTSNVIGIYEVKDPSGHSMGDANQTLLDVGRQSPADADCKAVALKRYADELMTANPGLKAITGVVWKPSVEQGWRVRTEPGNGSGVSLDSRIAETVGMFKGQMAGR